MTSLSKFALSAPRKIASCVIVLCNQMASVHNDSSVKSTGSVSAVSAADSGMKLSTSANQSFGISVRYLDTFEVIVLVGF